MANLKNMKPVELPEKDTRVIAMIYWKWVDAQPDTGEIIKANESIFFAEGEMNEDNNEEYIFYYRDSASEYTCGNIEELTVPRCGYEKFEDISENVYEVGDKVKSLSEIIVLDYITIIVKTDFYCKTRDEKVLSLD